VPELTPGAPAPRFSLVDHDGQPFGSDSLAGQRTVLYFFPKADTPG
jgi:thioredoxin-dependent peroxiredoxin